MQASEARRAVAAATSIASSLGLPVDDAIVLNDSNKLTVRLLPCDVLARVAPVAQQVAQFEIELAQRLAESESPVATRSGSTSSEVRWAASRRIPTADGAAHRAGQPRYPRLLGPSGSSRSRPACDHPGPR